MCSVLCNTAYGVFPFMLHNRTTYMGCKSNFFVCPNFFFKNNVIDKNFGLTVLQNSYDLYKNCKCITFE